MPTASIRQEINRKVEENDPPNGLAIISDECRARPTHRQQLAMSDRTAFGSLLRLKVCGAAIVGAAVRQPPTNDS